MRHGADEGAAPMERSSDDVVAAVQGELVAALRRADALRADAEQAREALERSHEQKDEFLAMLAHELRNPLGPILNAAEMLQTIAERDPAVERVTQILVRQTGLLTRLVDDLLDAARISRGKLELRREAVDLVSLVSSLAEDMDAHFRSRRLEFTCQLPSAPLWVHADPQRLTQAIGNLLSNAAKFTDAGGSVELKVAPEGQRVARITVSDTGIGMTDELISRVFESFSQARGNEPRNPSGLGLGTAIARGVVRLHGGTIAAESAGRGAGSTFTIRLPLHAPKEAATTPPESPPTPGVQRRVVVIDDNVDAAEVIQVMLESLGHVVSVAHDGRSGIGLVRRLAPDVVVCDIGLQAELDGLQVARELSVAGNAPYLVALTGFGRDEDRARALNAGFNVHLRKPVDLATLQRVVSELA
jgi:signal transduction histidine kinase